MQQTSGNPALSFEVTSGGGTRPIHRKPQVYTRNAPSFEALAPSGRYELPFDLGDGSWGPDAALKLLGTPGARLTAGDEVAGSPEAATHQVSTGQLRSAPASLP